MAQIKLDCMYEACPIPLIKAHKALEKMKKGDILILQTDHSCSIVNVVEWAKKQNLSVDYVEIAEGEWEIYIEKS
ncbi:TusA-related sulfurtransferase [Alkalithermobacter thermoalcaliphilus JW-YL-7 = DSM 7308]|uniref:SirA-like domain-containing protein n=1 Tax=Alkalithermobacter thermoalcaliphilus JW-YL-7 = DSM 7308 TaxID=1121328 RepID=A0A150FQN8_CLOPD|nr:SirA-like domain-containing protein [[Clostridium] paradoxum JW-YL-7 = DSM 7308]SHK76677.1 TusA-related sulfurtransferase [[Clostridium] paradoxum JW-YL-7 = DSM 7308]